MRMDASSIASAPVPAHVREEQTLHSSCERRARPPLRRPLPLLHAEREDARPPHATGERLRALRAEAAMAVVEEDERGAHTMNVGSVPRERGQERERMQCYLHPFASVH